MKSEIISIRFRAQEMDWLNKMCQGEGYTNRSEWIRHLVTHEAKKRRLVKTPQETTPWQTDMRLGKPRTP